MDVQVVIYYIHIYIIDLYKICNSNNYRRELRKIFLNILNFPHSPTSKGLVISKFTPSNVKEKGSGCPKNATVYYNLCL